MKGIQCKLARVALGWGVLELSSAASVSTQTVTRLERGDKLRPSTLLAIQSVLEANGIEFIAEDNRAGVGIRLKHKDASD
ncbi:helix-turn-helix transcriptional regulator [Rhizobium sp. 16-449-1b]|uniref:helix-turn-helix domain-containing protein n=1 Tax=Rhizobium sp. 16-449-1b TaxID=2819989 RepID=UPI001ADC0563|nr:helix-turn-helix transcriptional regulator [Rhizobium sp. 16-449-1b]MBO9198350.1 helix-turn-helix transcriptional regulator [Rhizobium sp. 16-449-1b]